MIEDFEKYKGFAARLVRNPNDIVALTEQSNLLITTRKTDVQHYYYLAKRAARIAPNDLKAQFNYANALEETGRFEEAVALYSHCLTFPDVAPMAAQILHFIGVTYRGMGDNERAIFYYDRSLELNPSSLYKRNKAISMMSGATTGTHSFVEALKAFEVRRAYSQEQFKAKGTLDVFGKLPAGLVHWQGESLIGKTIVVYHEDGIGDFIMMSRFIPGLRKLGAAKIMLTGPVPNLLEFMNDNLDLDGVAPLAGPFESDYVIGSMSLPWRLGIEYSDISGKPYVKATAANIPIRGELNVGLVWRGNPIYKQDWRRSMPFTEFVPLFDMTEAAFYSLQVGEPSTEITNLGFDGFVGDLQPFMKSWAQTARCIEALDIVVTVDTAVAHLAGALGKPVIVLVTRGADWRWHRDREETAWYDSARVVRQQTQDDWKPCIARVRTILEEMIDGRRLVERETVTGLEGRTPVARRNDPGSIPATGKRVSKGLARKRAY